MMILPHWLCAAVVGLVKWFGHQGPVRPKSLGSISAQWLYDHRRETHRDE
jgi:hypothetical protein